MQYITEPSIIQFMVSVVIPVFNRKEYVEKMILCIINQTYTNWELLLIDDGSTPDVVLMMKKYSQKDTRIKVYIRDKQPKGAPSCRNIGLQYSSGEYIMFLDSDDLISNTCIQNRVQFLELYNDIDFGIFPARYFNSRLSDDSRICFFSSSTGIKLGEDTLLSLFRGEYPCLVWTNLYRRRKIIEKNIKWKEDLLVLQDFDFNFKILSNNFKYRYFDIEADYYVRMNHDPNSISFNLCDGNKLDTTISLLLTVCEWIDSSTKYKRADLSGFLLFYYDRIKAKSSISQKYIKFCKNSFSLSFYLRLKILELIFSTFKNEHSYLIVKYLLFPRLLIRRFQISNIKNNWKKRFIA